MAPLANWWELSAGEHHWWVEPVLKSALLGPDGIRLQEWLGNGQATIVKKGPQRIVYRVQLNDGPVVYVKHNLPPDLRARLRQLVRPSKARIECDRGIEIAERGVPTIVPVALGEGEASLGGCESFLVTSALEDTQTLNTFMALTLAKMAPARQSVARQRLAIELGRFVARLHEAGICHDDLHTANILVQLTCDDQPRLFLLDLHAVRLGERLDLRASVRNLVIFTRWFVPRVSRADRLRFWRAYYEARGLGVWPQGNRGHREHFLLAREIEIRAHKSTLSFLKTRDRRCLENNRQYRRIRRPGLVGHVVADFESPLLDTLLADPDAVFRKPGIRLLKDSRSSTVAELECQRNGVTRRYIFKRFRVADWTDPLASLARPSATLRSWSFGHGFRERCLPTARPILVLHRVQAGMMREGYLLAEKIENAVDLHVFAADLTKLSNRIVQCRRRLAIDVVARVIRNLHRCQLSHRDLKATNLLIASDLDSPSQPFLPVDAVAPDGEISNLLPLPAFPVWFIDLAGVRLHGQLSRGRRVQNLARLHASFYQSQSLTRTDKLRFLRSYLIWNLVGRGAWKAWWKAIDRATLRKVARNTRRGRCLT